MQYLLVACGVVAVVSCTSNGDSIVQVGILRVRPDYGPEIDVPMTASAGIALVVKVTTHGNGCASDERTDVSPTSDGALVIPYDRYILPSAGMACTEIDQGIFHSAPLTFDAPGTYTVLVRVRGETSSDGVTVLYDHARTVIVQ